MADENLDTGVEQEVQTPQYSDIELRALDMGWKPRDQFSGDEENFVDAKEFVGRQKLYDKIASQNQKIKQVEQALEGFKTHYTTVNEAAYQRALADLKKERKQALSDGDGDKFEEIDEEIKSVEKQVAELHKANATPVVDQPVHPEFQNWVSKETWYTTTGYMRAFADDFGKQLAAQGVAPSDVLKQVSAAVRKEFPHKFQNPNKANAPSVENGASGYKASGSKTSFPLTEQERKIMNDLVRSGVMTKEKYIEDLKKIDPNR